MTEPSYGASMASLYRQRLLVDTDAYCKLGIAGLLTDAIATLGVQVEECGRLAALPYMLRRGRLRKRFGSEASDSLAEGAEEWPIALAPSDRWLDPLSMADSIDPGEAQLLAASAEAGLLMLTGDKRGLQGVRKIPGYAAALNGRIVVLEAILAELCIRRGIDDIRSRIQPLMEVDKTIAFCFSDSNIEPIDGLLSYYKDLSSQLGTLTLWKPPSLGTK